MLLQTEQRTVVSAGVLQTSRATIKASAKVFDFFATQTYSNKYLAICRELVANAIDAHTAAGKSTEPVEVWLPTDFYPSFRVKDTGIGMSHEFVMNEFMSYTDGSTKDGSNDMIGGFGIGSKSPFSYVDQFTLRSVFNQILSIYSVFKDTDGVPSVSLLEQTDTTEANGVEFSFPVETDDFSKFADAARKGLAYFDPLPTVHGFESGDPLIAPNFSQEGKGWGMTLGEISLGVVMGGVRYPVDYTELPYELQHHETLGALIKMGLDLFLPIGSCSITLSRETLLYDDRSTFAIQTALENIVDDITREIPKMFDKLPGRWEASKALANECGIERGNSYYRGNARAKLVQAHAAYKGEPLTIYSKIDKEMEKGWHIGARRPTRGHRRSYGVKVCPNPDWVGKLDIETHRIDHVIFDDLPPTSASATIKRLKTYVDDVIDTDEQLLVIRPFSQEAVEALGNPDYILTSSLPAPVRAKKTPGQGYVRPKVRMFQLDTPAFDNYPGSVHPTTYDSPVMEIDYADQPSTGVMLTMENFQLPFNFWKIMNTNLISSDELFLINSGDASKIAKNFDSFQDTFDERLANTLAENPTWENQLWLNENEKLQSLIVFVEANSRLFEDYSVKSTPMAKVFELRQKYYPDHPPHSIARFLTPKPISRLNRENLVTAFETKNWKVDALLTSGRDFIRPESKIFNLFKDVI